MARNSLSFIVKKGVVNGGTLHKVLCHREMKDARALTVKNGWRAMKTGGTQLLVSVDNNGDTKRYFQDNLVFL